MNTKYRNMKWTSKILPLIFLMVIFPPTILMASPGQPVSDQVWFAPNVGSVDMLDLFATPELWNTARSRIDIFKLNAGNVATGGWSCVELPHYNCGDNHRENLINVGAFQKLEEWGVGLALESFFAGPVMSLDPLECSTPQFIRNLSLDGSVNIIQSVESAGGSVDYLAMDEPLRQWLPEYYYTYTGQTDPRPCLTDSLDVLADYVADYILQLKVWFPTVSIGQIDLYPEIGVDQIIEWILALEARGVFLSFFHLDVHSIRIDSYLDFGLNLDVAADFRELKSFMENRGMALGIIYTDVYWDSQYWEEGDYTDSVYYNSTLEFMEFARNTGVTPHHSIFQSWVKPYYTTGPGPNEAPINLPENDPSIYSHTRLMNEVLGPTPTPVPSPTPSLPDEPGVRLEISSVMVSPGDVFWVNGYLDNPGPSKLTSIPVVFLLEVYGYYYFWPSWSLYHPSTAEGIDFETRDIDRGSTPVQVIPPFTWPDTGAQTAEDLGFYGALLSQDFSSIIGDYSFIEWGYGP